MENKLPYTIGIEYTFLPKENTEEYEIISSYANIIAKKLNYENVMNDDGAIEISSPIHKKWSEIYNFYKKIDKVKKLLELKTSKTIKDVYIGSGGGHIHIGLPNNKLYDVIYNLKNAVRFFAIYPELNWIFNEWCDDINANGYICNDKIFNMAVRGKAIQLLDDGYLGKSNIIRYCEEYNTIEFRFFNAPKDYKDVSNFVKFSISVMNKISQGIYYNKSDYDFNRKSLLNRTEQEVWERFERLLKILNLDVKDYKRYRKNLHERYLYGKLT